MVSVQHNSRIVKERNSARNLPKRTIDILKHDPKAALLLTHKLVQEEGCDPSAYGKPIGCSPGSRSQSTIYVLLPDLMVPENINVEKSLQGWENIGDSMSFTELTSSHHVDGWLCS